MRLVRPEWTYHVTVGLALVEILAALALLGFGVVAFGGGCEGSTSCALGGLLAIAIIFWGLVITGYFALVILFAVRRKPASVLLLVCANVVPAAFGIEGLGIGLATGKGGAALLGVALFTPLGLALVPGLGWILGGRPAVEG